MQPQELTEYRESLRLNMKGMGLVLGVTGAAIGLWESGKNKIPLTIAYLINAQKTMHRLILPRAPLILKPGDKAFIHKTIKVTITKAAPGYEDYRCAKCGGSIKVGRLHGVSHNNRHYCVKCVEER